MLWILVERLYKFILCGVCVESFCNEAIGVKTTFFV